MDENEWNSSYLSFILKIFTSLGKDPETAKNIASQGINAAHKCFTFVRNAEEIPLDDAFAKYQDDVLDYHEIIGEKSLSQPIMDGTLLQDLSSLLASSQIEADVLEHTKSVWLNLSSWLGKLKHTW